MNNNIQLITSWHCI